MSEWSKHNTIANERRRARARTHPLFGAWVRRSIGLLVVLPIVSLRPPSALMGMSGNRWECTEEEEEEMWISCKTGWIASDPIHPLAVVLALAFFPSFLIRVTLRG